MIKIVTLEEAFEILTSHYEQPFRIKTIKNKNIMEYEFDNVNYIQDNELIVSSGDERKKDFKIPLENIKQICVSDGIYQKTKYILITISYSFAEHICLHINF